MGHSARHLNPHREPSRAHGVTHCDTDHRSFDTEPVHKHINVEAEGPGAVVHRRER
jgi:hypothetical protein